MTRLRAWLREGNPLYNLNQYIYHCVFLGDDPHAPPNPEYVAKVIVLSVACFVAALIFLPRL